MMEFKTISRYLIEEENNVDLGVGLKLLRIRYTKFILIGDDECFLLYQSRFDFIASPHKIESWIKKDNIREYAFKIF